MPAFVYTVPSLPSSRRRNPPNHGHPQRSIPLTETSFARRSIPSRSQSPLKRYTSISPRICAQNGNFHPSSLDSGGSEPGEHDPSNTTPSVEQLSRLFDTLTTKFSSASRRNIDSVLASSVPDANITPPTILNSLNNATLPGASPLQPRAYDDLDDAAITDLLLSNPDIERLHPNEENDVLSTSTYGTNSVPKRFSNKPRKKDASASQNQTNSQSALHSSTDEDLILNMLAQSYAVSSDFVPTIEDIPLSSVPAFPGNNDAEPQHSKNSLSRDLQHQAQPCIQSADDLKRILSAVQKRRTFLSAESGEDTLPPLEVDPDKSLSFANIPRPSSDNEQVKDFYKNIREAAMENFFVGSVRGSLPINPHTLASSEEFCAITSLAGQISTFVSSPPNTYRPFLALHSAIVKLRNPPCPRCQTPTRKEVLARDGVCETCYTFIFLQSSFSNNPRDAIISREDTAREETRLAQQAASVFQASAMKESATTPSRDSKTPRPSSTTFTSQDGNDIVGNGGGSHAGQNQTPNVGDGWRVAASDRSLRTINPIRNLVQNIRVTPNPAKKAIKLSVGDPTVYGNLVVSASIVDALCKELKSGRSNGYSLSMGDASARAAIATRYSTSSSKLSPDDVFITSGASGALELAIGTLANEGDNILLPSPGFPLFRTLAEGFGIECRFYELDPEQNWQVKLKDLAKVVDTRTRAILVNNPSNPCGSVFSREHMEDIMAVAAALRLPVIADEVYADMVFTGEFESFGAVSAEVPTLVVGGISKQFVVPGWRVGWVLVHDRGNIFEKSGVKRGLRQLTTRMICANTPVQMVIPKMLEDRFGFQAIMKELQSNADFTAKSLKSVEGLKCVEARGAMYVMVGVDVSRMGLKDDMDFVERLFEEEAVFVLPGQCFKAPNFVRVVFAAPKAVLADAFSRMAAFCKRRIEGNL